jgi:hypothetical protein
MSRQAKRNLSWYCLMVFALGFVAIVGFEMREHKFMMADEDALTN